MNRVRRRVAAGVLALAVALAACSDEPSDPRAALIEAVQRTASQPVAFVFRATADSQALSALGDDATAAAAFLSGFEIAGSSAGGDLDAAVRVLGADLLRYVRVGDTTSLRLGLADVPGVPAELSDPARLVPVVRQLGLGEEAEGGVVALLQGGWLAIQGELTADGLREAAGVPAEGEPTSVGSLRDALQAWVEVDDVTAGGDRTTYRLRLRLRDLVAALTDAVGAEGAGGDPRIPETLPATAFVEDGVLTLVRVDITSLTSDDEQTEGTVELELELDDHGRAVVRPAPTPTTSLSAEAFLDAVARVLRFVGGVGVG